MTTRSGSVPVTLLTNALRARFPCEIRDHRVARSALLLAPEDPVSDVRLIPEEVPVGHCHSEAGPRLRHGLCYRMTLLSYRGHRFPAPIIQHAIWLYLRFTLSYRDVEELLAEHGLNLSYETIRRWVLKFG